MSFKELRFGESVGSRDIEAYYNQIESKKYLYLMAGVHGDEVEGVYVLSKLFNWINEIGVFKIPTVVIPILNVDGYNDQTRVNANGVDLNRNLPTNDWTNECKSEEYFPGKDLLVSQKIFFFMNYLKNLPQALFFHFTVGSQL